MYLVVVRVGLMFIPSLLLFLVDLSLPFICKGVGEPLFVLLWYLYGFYTVKFILVTSCCAMDLDIFCPGKCSSRHRWELPGNYPVFTVVMVIYHYVERIWRVLVIPIFLYNIYDH